MEEKVVSSSQSGSGLAKAAKIISIVIFSVVMACLLTTTISDVAIFSEQILQFIAVLIVTAFLFIAFTIFYVISFVLIFGFYINKSYGFWPFSLTKKTFLSMLGDIKFYESQVNTLVTIRWVVFVFCILCFVASIVALSLNKAAKKKGFEGNLKPAKKFSITTLILSILGMGVAGFVLLLVSSL